MLKNTNKKARKTQRIKSTIFDFGNFEDKVNISIIEETFKDKVHIISYAEFNNIATMLLGLKKSDKFIKFEFNIADAYISGTYIGKFSDYKNDVLTQQYIIN